MDRLPWTRFHLDGRHRRWAAPGSSTGWRSAVADAGRPHRGRDPRHLPHPGRPLGTVYLIGAGRRRAGVRAADRRARPPEAVHPHARRSTSSAAAWPACPRVTPLVASSRLPVRRRHGHRRRVRGDQLGDRRADPGEATAAASTSRSTAPTGAARCSGRSARSSCSTPSASRCSAAGGSAFFIGPVLGLVIIYLRRHIPESPRWLITHGRADEAERDGRRIEETVESQGGALRAGRRRARPSRSSARSRSPVPRSPGSCSASTRAAPSSASTMMITQSFLYNAIFFTYALVLTNFFDVERRQRRRSTSSPFAIGNLLGPLLLGHLFDTWGRRQMISADLRASAAVRAGDLGAAVQRGRAHRGHPDRRSGASSSSSPRPVRRRRT